MFNFTILRRDPRVWFAGGVLFIFAAAGLLAPWIAPFDPAANLGREKLSLVSPGWEHWFGTDLESRDVLSRMLFGARTSLATAACAVGAAVSLGTLIGIIAGAGGRLLDRALMSVADLFLGIPGIVLLLAAGAFLGKGQWTLILVLSLTFWMRSARLVRSEVVIMMNREFVLAARGLGVAQPAILWRHVLPHVIGPAIVSATLGVGGVLAAEATLSFLGFGIPEPAPSWGRMIQSGMEQISHGWWVSLFPAAAISLCVASANLLGDAFNEARAT
ncbi:MAG: ABC transporter permease [Planctomycetes bacterium]|nr:ABC transporter permease [Planctomycetota bacterium]